MDTTASRPIRRVLAALTAGGLLLALVAAPVAAEDPSAEPTPMIFARPQYLIHWGWHQTYDGPVKDDLYGLFTEPPIETGSFPGPDSASGSEHFVVPDGTGGVYHYFGETLDGPFTTDEELCSMVLGTTLPQTYEIWPPGSGSPTAATSSSSTRPRRRLRFRRRRAGRAAARPARPAAPATRGTRRTRPSTSRPGSSA